MNREESEAPVDEGGLQVPNIRHELALLSARTITHWMQPATSVGAAVGAALLQSAVHSTVLGPRFAPGRARTTRLSIRSSMGKTGVAVLQRALACPPAAAELELSRRARMRAGVGTSTTHAWEDGWLRRDFSRARAELLATHQYQLTNLGTLNPHGVFMSSVLDSGLLYLGSGARLQKRHLPGLDVSGKTTGEVLSFHRVNAHTAKFQSLLSEPLSPVAARSFRLLCDLLVFSYPALLILRADGPHHLRARPDSDTVWSLRVTGHRRVLYVNRGPGNEELGVVSTLAQAHSLARRTSPGVRIRFDPHPLLSAIVPIWSSQHLPSGRGLRSIVAEGAWARSKQATTDRQAQAALHQADIAEALNELSWDAVHKMAYASSRQRLCMYRVKSDRVPGYSVSLGRYGCPHCPDIGSAGGRLGHILWSCPSAQSLWTTVRASWRELGAWVSDHVEMDVAFRGAVFSTKLLAVPPKVWDLPSLIRLAHRNPSDPIDVFPTMQAAWQHHVTTTFLMLLQWRNGMHDERRAWTPAQAQGSHRAALRHALRQLKSAVEASTPAGHPGPEILSDIAALVHLTTTSMTRYLLSFDGGSRGNPGPGGAGAVIVATDATASSASLVWSASISLARSDTTNNQAEYRGVIAGLQLAESRRLQPLEVIGDSTLILRQLQNYRAPRNAKLHPLYATARRFADRIGVEVWLHHLRHQNKMADHLANVAMDRRDSIQVLHPHERAEHAGLACLLSGDFCHWQELAVSRMTRTGLPH